MRTVLVTGTAGFIGFHLARLLLAEGFKVVGVDAMTAYYDVEMKQRRHAILRESNAFSAEEFDILDHERLLAFARHAAPDAIVHLAAQAGVRYSLEKPEAYASANLLGMVNMLELCRALKPRHFLFGSTSSVYGMSDKPEFVETDTTDRPVSLYAASKKSGEVMAHSYAHLFAIPTTVCRFFTVYGPYGRPDMSLFKFVRAILNDEPIEVFGEGAHERDFTYVGDLVEAVTRLVGCIPEIGNPVAGGVTDTLSAIAPYREVNIAGGRTVGLMRYIETIEEILEKKARLNLLPMQAGDVLRTAGSPALLEALTGYRPGTGIGEGMTSFIDWYLAEVHSPSGPVS